MDHEVLPRPCKICDWLLNLSWDYFDLHWGKLVRVTMKFEVPKRHILRPTLSTDMVQQICGGEAKRCSSSRGHGSMANDSCYNHFFGEIKCRQEKTRELPIFRGFFLLLPPPPQMPIFGYIFKTLAHSLWVHDQSSWSTFIFHPMRGPKALWIVFNFGRSLPLILMHTSALMTYLSRGYLSCRKDHKV